MRMYYTDKFYQIIKSNVKDNLMKKQLYNYVDLVINETNHEKINIGFYAKYRYILLLFSDISINQLSWDNLCELMQGEKNKNKISPSELRKIYSFFYKEDLIQDEYKDYLKANNEILEMNIRGTNIIELFDNLIPPNFYYKSVKQGEQNYVFINLNTKNEFLRFILIKYLDSIESNVNSTRIKKFIRYFDASLRNVNRMEDVTGFNNDTFRLQYRFFKRVENKSVDLRLSTSLIKFYIFLNHYIEQNRINHEIFRYGDRVNINYLYRKDFKKLYESGVKLYYFNRLGEITEESKLHDKLLVCPNGYEDFSSALRKDQYTLVEFSKVNNNELKNLLKLYFQFNDTTSLITLYRRIKALVPLINFISTILNNEKVVQLQKSDKIIFSPDIILLVRIYIINNYKNNTTRNNYLTAVKDFLRFLYDNSLANIYYECFELLKLLPKADGRIKPIEKHDLDKLIEYFKKRKMTGGINEKIEWIIFQIKLTTNLRISEIVNLKIENINLKEGLILVKRKGSGHKLVEYYASKYLIELLKFSIDITADFRKNSKKEIRDYVFLYKSKYKNISVISREVFNDTFKQIVKSIDEVTMDYVAYDLRDTFMTNVVNDGKKQGKSMMEIHNLTGHKQFETTIKHYLQSSIQEYVETFFKVKIGFNNIRGKILDSEAELREENDSRPEERLVKQNCGYCSFNDCVDAETIDCLTCDYFITTLDRIPIFRKSIAEIETEIEKENNNDEKNALIKIKELYLIYLTRMLEKAALANQ